MGDVNYQNNRVVWVDILVGDLDRAIQFYTAVLGCGVDKEQAEGVEFGVLDHEQGNAAA